jgi:hypothetical protein
MKIRVPEHELLEDGLYTAQLLEIKPEDGERGVYWRWTFTVRTENGGEKGLIANSSASLSRRSKAYGWLTAALARELEPGEEIDFDATMPLVCRIMVKRSEDGEFDRVEDVLKANPRAHADGQGQGDSPVPRSQTREAQSLMEQIDTMPADDDDIPF